MEGLSESVCGSEGWELKGEVWCRKWGVGWRLGCFRLPSSQMAVWVPCSV